MSFIAEFTIETPILQEALDAVPEMVVQTEAFHIRGDEATKSLIWAWGDDFRTFERNLETDPTVGDYEQISTANGRRLYRMTHTETAEEVFTYPVLAEHDAILLDSTGTHEEVEIRARFPGRDALTAYRAACRERGIPFHLERLYQENQIERERERSDPYGLTEPQREALVRALEMGYFDIPQQTTLKEISDELDITAQAVSARLRRGQKSVLETIFRH